MLTEYEPYENLANAIVEMAVYDYKAALRRLKKNPNNSYAKTQAVDLERFFHSDWYDKLTDVDPDRLITGVKLLVEKELAQKDANFLKKEADIKIEALIGVIEDFNSKEWAVSKADGYKFKGLVFETMNRLEAAQAAQKATDKVEAKAIRSVGFMVRE